jgi:prophage antirepressor-like protein
MKNNIKIFEHAELGDIRVIQGEDNEPWFAAKDICETLGFIRPSDALRGLDSDVDLLKWEGVCTQPCGV